MLSKREIAVGIVLTAVTAGVSSQITPGNFRGLFRDSGLVMQGAPDFDKAKV